MDVVAYEGKSRLEEQGQSARVTQATDKVDKVKGEQKKQAL